MPADPNVACTVRSTARRTESGADRGGDFARFADLLRARFAGAFRFRGAARLVRFLGAPAANLP